MLAWEIGVRQWAVAAVTCWFELSLLGGLLRSALLCASFLGATLFRCGLLSTFLSCHSLSCSFFLSLGFDGHNHKMLYLLRSCGLE